MLIEGVLHQHDVDRGTSVNIMFWSITSINIMLVKYYLYQHHVDGVLPLSTSLLVNYYLYQHHVGEELPLSTSLCGVLPLSTSCK